jgi:KUP system potassium uptake protein
MSTVDRRQALRPAIVVGALGVVFGDIGTSPIYTVQTVFNPGDPHPVPISTDNVYGVVSTICWSVMIIVTLTYVMLVMRAAAYFHLPLNRTVIIGSRIED